MVIQTPKETKQTSSGKRRFSLRRWSDLAIALLLGLLVSVIWITNSDLWSRAAWDVPVGYETDSHQIIGWIKAASEGDYHLLEVIRVSRLGTPFGANWNDYPMYEKAFTILLGWLARSIGLFASANVGMMLTHVTAAMSFYLACRFFRWHRAWSFAGALLFAFDYYMTKRSLGHMLLGLTYTIPWAIFATWLILGKHHLKRFSRSWKFCLGVSFLMGVSNPYYLNIYVQLILLALAFQWFTLRQRENIQTGLLCLLVSGFGFLLAHTGTLFFRLFAGANPYAVARAYRESEMYALRPIEFFIPPLGHRVPSFSDLGMFYQNETLNRADVFSPYLGVIGGAGLILLLAVLLRRMFLNQNRRIPAAGWQSLWIVAYSVVGGFNCFLALGGIGLFRASGRNSIFIIALVLLWLIPVASRSFKHWPVGKSWLVALAIAGLGIIDQLPYANREKDRAAIQTSITSDRDFCQQLEARLPAHAAVFQLPLAAFPEGNPVINMGSYEHLRPYFFTSTLRFNYGMNKGRSDSSWQAEIERMPATEMVKQLEKLGFHVLYLNRRGFVDDGDGLLKTLAQMGYQEKMESADKNQVAVFLKPQPDPDMPRTDVHTINHFGNFWARHDLGPEEVLWISMAYAEIQLNPDLFKNTKARLRASVMVPSDRKVKFLIGNVVFAEKKLLKNRPYQVEFELPPLEDGKLLRIDTDQPSAVFQGGSYTPGAFALLHLDIVPIP
jgi:hypothetical protein